MLKVITTVGTSIFENLKEKNENSNLNERYISKPFVGWDEERSRREKSKIKEWINNVGDKKEISAEIKSVLKLQEEKDEELDIYLLATDTVASSLAAEIIKEILKKDFELNVFFNPRFDVVKGLQIEDSKRFVKEGLVNLINRIERIADGYYDNVIFNITGGYKGIIPYTTIMAIVNNCEIKYIYEKGERLITIPQLPLGIDEEIFENNYEVLTKIERGLDDYIEFKNSNFSVCNKLEKNGLIDYEGNIAILTPIGSILFKAFKNKYVWFYCSKNIYNEIIKQDNIVKILKEKFFSNYKDKTEIKEGHSVYDDGKNAFRIFYFEKDNKIYIYKTFEDHDKYETYLNKSMNINNFKNDYLSKATIYSLRKIE